MSQRASAQFIQCDKNKIILKYYKNATETLVECINKYHLKNFGYIIHISNLIWPLFVELNNKLFLMQQ